LCWLIPIRYLTESSCQDFRRELVYIWQQDDGPGGVYIVLRTLFWQQDDGAPLSMKWNFLFFQNGVENICVFVFRVENMATNTTYLPCFHCVNLWKKIKFKMNIIQIKENYRQWKGDSGKTRTKHNTNMQERR